MLCKIKTLHLFLLNQIQNQLWPTIITALPRRITKTNVPIAGTLATEIIVQMDARLPIYIKNINFKSEYYD